MPGRACLPASAGQTGPVPAAQALFREQRSRNTVDSDAEKRSESGIPWVVPSLSVEGVSSPGLLGTLTDVGSKAAD